MSGKLCANACRGVWQRGAVGVDALVHCVFAFELSEDSTTSPEVEVRGLREALRQVRIEAMPGTAGVVIRVEDDGPGMPDALARDIGRPFETGGGVLSRNHGGAGLGLAIVRRLVTLMGGRIRVETGRLGGAMVIVDLPDRQIDDRAA